MDEALGPRVCPIHICSLAEQSLLHHLPVSSDTNTHAFQSGRHPSIVPLPEWVSDPNPIHGSFGSPITSEMASQSLQPFLQGHDQQTQHVGWANIMLVATTPCDEIHVMKWDNWSKFFLHIYTPDHLHLPGTRVATQFGAILHCSSCSQPTVSKNERNINVPNA